MSLRASYTLLAPFYDAAVARATMTARRNSLARLQDVAAKEVLLVGIGSGLDIPLLPPSANYFGMDLTPAMLRRAAQRDTRHQIALLQADAMSLPYRDQSFDWVVMHLILAVVPQPQLALAEAMRVVKPGGRILILDKFLRPGPAAPLMRLINPLISRIATRTNVEFEPLLTHTPSLIVEENSPAMLGQWFRHIVLMRQ